MSGDCFAVAGKLVTADNSLTLVHGEVLAQEGGTAPVGEYHWHAWCESTQTHHVPYQDRTVPVTITTFIDKSNGNDVELPVELAYKIGQPRNVRRYTATEAMTLMVQTGHYGPWEEDDDG